MMLYIKRGNASDLKKKRYLVDDKDDFKIMTDKNIGKKATCSSLNSSIFGDAEDFLLLLPPLPAPGPAEPQTGGGGTDDESLKWFWLICQSFTTVSSTTVKERDVTPAASNSLLWSIVAVKFSRLEYTMASFLHCCAISTVDVQVNDCCVSSFLFLF